MTTQEQPHKITFQLIYPGNAIKINLMGFMNDWDNGLPLNQVGHKWTTLIDVTTPFQYKYKIWIPEATEPLFETCANRYIDDQHFNYARITDYYNEPEKTKFEDFIPDQTDDDSNNVNDLLIEKIPTRVPAITDQQEIPETTVEQQGSDDSDAGRTVIKELTIEELTSGNPITPPHIDTFLAPDNQGTKQEKTKTPKSKNNKERPIIRPKSNPLATFAFVAAVVGVVAISTYFVMKKKR
eukprot:TRINITY_DN2692_c0_g1_i1.p1 TRINITY_DN2692_c0_g1~~TRINITY_DN2692_c0_g1_i1.p1  ORF type:complete len:239 (-),score=41.01 TRINITY_DN2692_c0_g1_i1:138-854(-)